MSNRVGELYSLIIDQVVKETKTEIEESGEDPAVPEMLRDAWKKRLSEMNVTREPLWSSDSSSSRSLRQDAMGGTPTLNLAGLNNLPMTADPLALYGVPSVANNSNNNQPVASPSLAASGNGSVPGQVKSESPLESMSKSTTSAGMNLNPLGGVSPPHQSQTHQNGPALSPELQNQIKNAMENHHTNIPQTDGTQDEELNSDLDDSEDELNSNDEDEDTDQTQIMLCLYEKVHKVKTRWKYTLKDGIANVNGLDYVFAKATGESEW